MLGGKHQRHEGRHDRIGERVAQRPHEIEAAAIGAGLRERFSTRAEDDPLREDLPGTRRYPKARLRAADCRDACRVEQSHTCGDRLADECVEDRSRRVGDGKELAGVRLSVELHPRFRKESDRIGNGEPPNHLADRRRRAAGEVGLAHRVVRDVAPAPAGHQDFRPDLFRPVDGNDRERLAGCRRRTAGPGGGEQARGAGTDDKDVDIVHGGGGCRLQHRYHR